MARRIGVLGGTFDPIHHGHLDVGTAAEEALGLTRVIVITSNIPPHRPQPVASAYYRFAMVALAIADRPAWQASDVELRASTPSYTSGTLATFHERGYLPSELFFVIGADAFADIATWRDYPSILDAAHFAVVSRPGFPVGRLRDRLPQLAARMTPLAVDRIDQRAPMIFLIDAPTADVSSSAIRRRIAAGEAITGLVPLGVQQHIEQHELYQSVTTGQRASDARQLPTAGRLHGKD